MIGWLLLAFAVGFIFARWREFRLEDRCAFVTKGDGRARAGSRCCLDERHEGPHLVKWRDGDPWRVSTWIERAD